MDEQREGQPRRYHLSVYEEFEKVERADGAIVDGASLGWTAVAQFGTPGTYSWGSVLVGRAFVSPTEALQAARDLGYDS